MWHFYKQANIACALGTRLPKFVSKNEFDEMLGKMDSTQAEHSRLFKANVTMPPCRKISRGLLLLERCKYWPATPTLSTVGRFTLGFVAP